MLIIGDWIIDITKGLASKQDQQESHPLDEQMCQVLTYLADNQHRIVTTAELLKQFWSGNEQASAQMLNKTIEHIRQLLDPPAQSVAESAISTIDDSGYLLNLPVYHYDFEAVTEAQIRADILRHKQIEQRRQVRCVPKPTEEQSTKPNWLDKKTTKLLMVIVLVVVVFYFSSQ